MHYIHAAECNESRAFKKFLARLHLQTRCMEQVQQHFIYILFLMCFKLLIFFRVIIKTYDKQYVLSTDVAVVSYLNTFSTNLAPRGSLKLQQQEMFLLAHKLETQLNDFFVEKCLFSNWKQCIQWNHFCLWIRLLLTRVIKNLLKKTTKRK